MPCSTLSGKGAPDDLPGLECAWRAIAYPKAGLPALQNCTLCAHMHALSTFLICELMCTGYGHRSGPAVQTGRRYERTAASAAGPK
jgi:hypothetical protein